MRQAKPDTAWLEAKIAASEAGSLRQLAFRMRNRLGNVTAPSQLSRALSGERELLLHEVRQLADLLGVPMGELIRRMGVGFSPKDNVRAGKKRG